MRVEALWRYPVKSMGGERLTAVGVGPLGLDGDRRWGVVDHTTGNVLTGRREPRLLHAAAAVTSDGDLVVVLPDGTVVRGSDAGADAALAAWLGRDVGLAQAADEGGVYESPQDVEAEGDWRSWRGPPHAWHDSPRVRVSLVSTATLDGWDVRRFRPNVLLAGRGEDDLVGRRLALGTAVVEVAGRVNRCVMVNRAQPGLAEDRSVLRTIRAERAATLAIGAIVTTPGAVAVGDELADLGDLGEDDPTAPPSAG